MGIFQNLLEHVTAYVGDKTLMQAAVSAASNVIVADSEVDEGEVEVALAAGDLEGVESEQVAFEIHAIAQGVNQAHMLREDPKATERGRTAMLRSLRP